MKKRIIKNKIKELKVGIRVVWEKNVYGFDSESQTNQLT